MTDQPLRLMAESRADLEVMSSFLQDAAVKVGDIAWQPGQHRFAAVLNRYRWEQDSAKKSKSERVRSGLRIEGVLKAAYRNIPLNDPDHVLGLLAIEVEEGEDGAGVLTLACSGYASIRLEVECLDAYLEDLTRPWRALGRPGHDLPEHETPGHGQKEDSSDA